MRPQAIISLPFKREKDMEMFNYLFPSMIYLNFFMARLDVVGMEISERQSCPCGFDSACLTQYLFSQNFFLDLFLVLLTALEPCFKALPCFL